MTTVQEIRDLVKLAINEIDSGPLRRVLEKIPDLLGAGSAGPAGAPGTNGTNGAPGINGTNGAPGTAGPTVESDVLFDSSTVSTFPTFDNLITASIVAPAAGFVIASFQGSASNANGTAISYFQLQSQANGGGFTIEPRSRRAFAPGGGAGAPTAIPAVKKRIAVAAGATLDVLVQFSSSLGGTTQIRPVTTPDLENAELVLEFVNS